METILKKAEKTFLDETIGFLKALTSKEQQEMNAFIQGFKFARQVEEKKTA